MPQMNLDSKVIEDAQQTIGTVTKNIQLQIDNLNEVTHSIEGGLRSSSSEELVQCVVHTQQKLKSIKRYLGSGARDLNGIAHKVSLAEKIMNK